MITSSILSNQKNLTATPDFITKAASYKKGIRPKSTIINNTAINRYLNTEVNNTVSSTLSTTADVRKKLKLENFSSKEPKSFNGPLDLSTLCFKPLRVLKETILDFLNSHKIHYKNLSASSSAFVCDRAGLKFEVEICCSEDTDELYIIKFKKLEGSYITYKEVCRQILSKINTN